MGRPKTFQSPEQLYLFFKDYISYCENSEKMPNIAGFMVFLYENKDIQLNRTSFYEYKNYEEYSNTLKAISEALEDSTLNNKTQKDLIKLAYLNNRCGYTNKSEQTSTVTMVLDDSTLDSRLIACGYKLIEHSTE